MNNFGENNIAKQFVHDLQNAAYASGYKNGNATSLKDDQVIAAMLSRQAKAALLTEINRLLDHIANLEADANDLRSSFRPSSR